MDTQPIRKWYTLAAADVTEALHSDAAQGLTQQEAERRLAKQGANQLAEQKRKPLYSVFVDQFKDFMVLILFIATLISYFLGEYLDAIAIIAIILINGILGFIQEAKAERSLQALKELASPMARVIRGGHISMIPASRLVPGDLVQLEAGDRVPADLRLLSANRLEVEESALTGESVPVGKNVKKLETAQASTVPLGDQKNLAFMGTMVTGGTGSGIVVATGMSTEIGKIAHLMNTAEEAETPLQLRLEQMGKILVVVALLLTIVVIAAGVWHGHELFTMFLAGVSLAVAAIPEGLPAIVTVALALGVQRMIRRNAIVRKLPSVETLGCASVICSDKTGTLTQNKMTVTQVWHSDSTYEVSGSGYAPEGAFHYLGKMVSPARDGALTQIIRIADRCNNARLTCEEQSTRNLLGMGKTSRFWQVVGDPTEGALKVLAAKALGGNTERSNQKNQGQRVEELPFDSDRKMMSVVEKGTDGVYSLLTKGAAEALLARSTHILWKGELIPLSATLRYQVLEQTERMAGKALRVLGFAYKTLQGYRPGQPIGSLENNLVFVGLAGMIDPPREEVRPAINLCHQAGIKTVMITGDHKVTAEAIARQIGLMRGYGEVLEGRELDNMSDEQLAEYAERVTVYARVSPEHKLRIVRALQSQGHVVAMTGDGVNDAPAIKTSDIGIAMGITGTDVTKEAADLVLRDDNFATIVAAVEEGRNIYDNIRKFIRYLLASNVGEILVMFFAMLLGLPLPLVPIQILWVNLVTDGLPAMALGVDQAEKDTMYQQPRNKAENIFSRGLGWKIISRGFLIGTMTLLAFWLTLKENPNDLVHAQTVAFVTLVMAQLIHVFDCRSQYSVFHRNVFENKYLVWAVLSSIVLVIGVVYMEALQPIFKTTDLNLRDWALILVAAGVPTFVAGIGGVLTSGRQRAGKEKRPAMRTVRPD
ncbi:calcium-translocating P-type ATPase, SERCA-type [Brevibacillus brevis]|uniref:calcium-translocating P-type ATPase, SERCA-type n=1 Tax=Brevibacillus brevis TaxID=1393 RepID=UPI000D0F29E8|nr:calcium-translocating P-type ATPase, SERCA-type [Brevibacillus brevis]PSJ70944.1 calcium-translocating P-type ATPase, SERCA-type [Brevibacillus brevis]RED24297.1 Ca2+-transporting ATPase [Brevibacillus brevis]GEC91945.1 calcium-translocating P-type ATPase, SERCA-type [Brevibacillus brevis]VEF91872.1 Calcium-transporting ATPase [Brevibacillus brevis]